MFNRPPKNRYWIERHHCAEDIWTLVCSKAEVPEIEADSSLLVYSHLDIPKDRYALADITITYTESNGILWHIFASPKIDFWEELEVSGICTRLAYAMKFGQPLRREAPLPDVPRLLAEMEDHSSAWKIRHILERDKTNG
jgi:hypothetical protein